MEVVEGPVDGRLVVLVPLSSFDSVLHMDCKKTLVTHLPFWGLPEAKGWETSSQQQIEKTPKSLQPVAVPRKERQKEGPRHPYR